MDLRTYYQKIRDKETEILTASAVVISLPTDDGGKGGVMVEVPRHLAAKMIVEGSARLALEAEAADFRQAQAAAAKASQDAAAEASVSVTVVSSDELKKLTDEVKKLKPGAKPSKE